MGEGFSSRFTDMDSLVVTLIDTLKSLDISDEGVVAIPYLLVTLSKAMASDPNFSRTLEFVGLSSSFHELVDSDRIKLLITWSGDHDKVKDEIEGDL